MKSADRSITHARVCAFLAALVIPITACQRQSEPSASTATVPKRPVDQARLEAADSDAANWLTTGRTYSEQRFSPLIQINDQNVGQLRLAWHHDLDAIPRGQESTPLVVDGVMYVSTTWSKVFALDARTGKLLWEYDPKVPGEWGINACCDVVNRGVAFWKDKVYLGTLDGRLVALDAATGTPVWETQTVDRSQRYAITGAPRVIRNKVIIGNAGSEFGVRGYISAYDADTGELVWRFYTVPGEPGKKDGAASDEVLEKIARPTWTGEWWKLGGGGTVWDAMAYDPELDLLYFGTGNGTPWSHTLRSPDGGDNLFLASIIAVKAETGEYVWHFQTVPGEDWDYTCTQSIVQADLEIDGEKRKVLLHAPKNGFFYVLDRATGKLISAQNYVPVTWASRIDLETGRPVENPEARYGTDPVLVAPGPAGGHNWFPMAYNPITKLAYFPAYEHWMVYALDPNFKPTRFRSNAGWGGYTGEALAKRRELQKEIERREKTYLLAWDPVKQEATEVPHARHRLNPRPSGRGARQKDQPFRNQHHKLAGRLHPTRQQAAQQTARHSQP